ncbi:MAG TPA: hypothetical protein VM369_06810 [Candidatus Binatia bacterium]|nr:hypothetical protein [Candidatus Binatia bacterium]
MTRAFFVLLLPGLLAACAGEQPRAESRVQTPEPYCLTETGSRIPPQVGRCVNGAGRSVSREELERTGRFDAGDALGHIIP